MPAKPIFMDSSKLLSGDKIIDICRVAQQHGIEEFRVTGGEPLVRGDAISIIKGISALSPRKLGLTTNGFFLKQHLDFLKSETTCHHINISVDSLDEGRFNKITRRKAFGQVMAAITHARELELPIKLNVIAIRGFNDDELVPFVRFSERSNIPVRFLELMRIGRARDMSLGGFISAQEIMQKIGAEIELTAIKSAHDSTSFNFTTEGGGQVGFIASESMPFCGSCSRWRLTADGHLRACLMSQEGISLKDLRADQYEAAFRQLLPMKPTHRIKEITQDMNQIGG